MQDLLQANIINYVIPKLRKRPNQASRGSPKPQYQMDELTKKILRGIKMFFRRTFANQLRGKAHKSRKDEYLQLLVKFFRTTLNCNLQL